MVIDRDYALIEVTAAEALAYATNPNDAAVVQEAAQQLADELDRTVEVYDPNGTLVLRAAD